MSDNKPDGAGPLAWAHLRFSIIGPLLASPPPEGHLREEIAALAARTWRHPVDPEATITFGYSTIERWYYLARAEADPVAVLARKVRSDAGTEKALSAPLREALAVQYGEHPSWSYQLHADNLAVIAAGDPRKFGPAPSYSTVRKAMKRRGWNKRKRYRHPTPGQKAAMRRIEQREVRSYENPFVFGLLHLDFHDGRRRVVDASGEWQQPALFAVLDDRSRLCCHIQWYLGETAENLVHGFVQGLCKRGLPRALMHDNGSAMRSAEFKNGLARLGILQEPTLEYSPDQNGKQEVFWSSVEGRLMAMLEDVEPLTLDFLNRATAAWVEGDYNHQRHEEIGTSPVASMLAGPDVSRPAPASDALWRAFSRRATRVQRASDGTVSVCGVRFELPSRLRTIARPTLRWRSWDLSIAWVVDPRTDEVVATVYPQDKAKNADGRRRLLEAVSDTPVPEPKPDRERVPPLLRKLLDDYAATGLPPAYLPKDEVRSEEESDE